MTPPRFLEYLSLILVALGLLAVVVGFLWRT